MFHGSFGWVLSKDSWQNLQSRIKVIKVIVFDLGRRRVVCCAIFKYQISIGHSLAIDNWKLFYEFDVFVKIRSRCWNCAQSGAQLLVNVVCPGPNTIFPPWESSFLSDSVQSLGMYLGFGFGCIVNVIADSWLALVGSVGMMMIDDDNDFLKSYMVTLYTALLHCDYSYI